MRVHRAHLVGDRADAADARGDVGRFGKVPPAQKGFEQSGRLVDLQFDIRDAVALELDVEGAFALYAGQGVDSNRFCCRARSFVLTLLAGLAELPRPGIESAERAHDLIVSLPQNREIDW